MLEDWFIQARGGQAAEELIGDWRSEAERQVDAATANGLPLEWWAPKDQLSIYENVLSDQFPSIKFVGC
ncbi:MAG TPA: hypothetical protein VMS17_05000 [Gemmataceae bacterium]|nr:hypothetical protein [Gemmataceae bacterium]